MRHTNGGPHSEAIPPAHTETLPCGEKNHLHRKEPPFEMWRSNHGAVLCRYMLVTLSCQVWFIRALLFNFTFCPRHIPASWSWRADPCRAGKGILIKQLSARRSFDFPFQLPCTEAREEDCTIDFFVLHPALSLSLSLSLSPFLSVFPSNLVTGKKPWLFCLPPSFNDTPRQEWERLAGYMSEWFSLYNLKKLPWSRYNIIVFVKVCVRMYLYVCMYAI